jgi:hypothetical protein
MHASTAASAHGHVSGRAFASERYRRALLACGIAAFVWYIALDIAASLLYDGYSYRDQTISELSAIGAPTRSFMLPLGAVYSALTIAVAVGVWMSAGDRRGLRAIAVLAGTVGLLGFIGWPFAPMHQREVLAAGGGDIRDTMHLALGGINSLIFITSIVIGAVTFRGGFRLFTLGLLAVIFVFGFLTWTSSPGVADNDPTPWLGVYERIAIEGSMLWYAALAVVLLRERPATET